MLLILFLRFAINDIINQIVPIFPYNTYIAINVFPIPVYL